MLCQQYSNHPKEKQNFVPIQIFGTAQFSYKLSKLGWFVHSEIGQPAGSLSLISEISNKSFKIGWLIQSILMKYSCHYISSGIGCFI